jgi:hypothetical protein
MGLIREPKNVDFSMKSEPWTEEELADFSKLIKEYKEKNKKEKHPVTSPKKKKITK